MSGRSDSGDERARGFGGGEEEEGYVYIYV